MSEDFPPTGAYDNIWAPWRMEYLDGLGDESTSGCFLCAARDEPARDEANDVLFRGEHCLTMLNRFPYTGGHCLIAPYEHVGSMAALSPEALTEMMELLRDLQAAIRKAIHAEGFNVGFNIGRCAGAGLPDHIHGHLVPRWEGDTNFMQVLGNVRVIPEFLAATRQKLLAAARELSLPTLRVE
ncbi:MAG: HIT domain-containing protein [Planctomycetes bacterium]|jgi:ATP adenylyltransferase|nr:HIT domain-containing protein [Phycisphaerae bacterium]NBB95406.1 HIT domain-containing protein [Planctomycetota bacterium]